MNNATQVPIIIFAILLSTVTVGVVLYWLFQQQKKLNEAFQRFAKKRDGNCHVGSLLSNPSVDFFHRDRETTLNIYSTGGKHPTLYMRIETPWPDEQMNCYIYPERLIHRLGKMVGLKDIETGNYEFDKAFMVRGNQDDVIRRMLGGDAPEAIRQLRLLFNKADLLIAIDKGNLMLRKKGLKRDEDSLDQFADACMSVADCFFAAVGVGVSTPAADRPNAQPTTLPAAPVQSSPVAVAAPAAASQPAPATSVAAPSATREACQFCGMFIEKEKELVFCRSCNTAHHKGCWKCNGGCSMFGCKQRKFK